MKCSLGYALAEASASQREIAQMVLDDREGYSGIALGAALAQVLPLTQGGFTGADVETHRSGDCVCTELRALS